MTIGFGRNGTPKKRQRPDLRSSRCHETPLGRLANNEDDGAAPCEARARVIYIFDFFLAFFFFAMVFGPFGGC